MDNKEVVSQLIAIHNIINCISVRGDDAIRMASALSAIRNLAEQLGSKPPEGSEVK